MISTEQKKGLYLNARISISASTGTALLYLHVNLGRQPSMLCSSTSFLDDD